MSDNQIVCTAWLQQSNDKFLAFCGTIIVIFLYLQKTYVTVERAQAWPSD